MVSPARREGIPVWQRGRAVRLLSGLLDHARTAWWGLVSPHGESLPLVIVQAVILRPRAASAAAREGGAAGEEVLLSFRGVGPKCANLALGIACGKPGIAVDIHVHRVVNRWGYVRAEAPEKTMRALVDRLPKSYWIEINSLLVPFGKHICKGTLPRCSTCPVLSMCQQVGVDRHR